ncbi:MAG: 4Fe-4S binding protein [Candidatus Aminicenantales bacterium]
MIKVELSKCTGCKRCQTACSFFRSGRISDRLARIKVLNLYQTGIDGPVVCCRCQERYCLSCPEKAITIGERGQVIVSPTICTLCGFCQKACPIGAIEMFDKFVYVCDLCGGRPRCVEACTEGVISYQPEEKERPSLAAFKKHTKKMNPSQKRYYYLSQLAQKIRSKWREKHA